MARLFISQERLDVWSSENKAKIEANRLTLKELGKVFIVEPAVRFLRVAGGEDDPHDLVDRVKTEEELVNLGADLYMNSVIHGETAYDVQAGFVGIPTNEGA